MKKIYGLGLLAALAMALGTSQLTRADGEPAPLKPPPASPEKQEAQLKAVAPSMVIVEYTLQYDKGEAPTGGGFEEKSPLGRAHPENLADVVKEERPLERAGLLVDGTHVLTSDIQIHPRFIKSITVRRYGQDAKTKTVPATVWGYPKEQNALVLELSGTLEGAVPLVFDAKRGGDGTGLSVVTMSNDDAAWALGVEGFSTSLVMVGDKKTIQTPSGLVVDKNGAAVGVSTGADVKPDGSWKGNPMEWPMISAADMKKSLAALDQHAAKTIVRVMLNFRSPKTSEMDAYRGVEAGATVQYVLGVLTDQNTVLVLSELRPTVTARLERIKVLTDPPVEARFKASLKDYGAFVATLEKPVTEGLLTMSQTDLQSLKGAALPSAEIFLQGEKRLTYQQPRRLAGFSVGWKRNVYPEVSGESKGLFLFDPAGAMAALPLSHREKASMDRYGGGGQWLVTPVTQVLAAMSDLKNNAAPGNIPLTEDQENRLAWIGFEMQPMNTELARANNVSDQTSDGDTGALVTYVYPDSPAAKAGVEANWILLRIEAEDQPKPIDVRINSEPYSEHSFPWDQLEAAPESVFDKVLMYSPWPRAENTLTRTLTDLGFGSKFTADFYHDGKVEKKQFTVVESPPHFDNAPKFKHEGMGLTVKDLTYEVRRYMQKKTTDPGVIVGKIEMGSKASKAGLKPYEVITHVNDQPVMNVKDFEKLTKGQSEVRLSVKLMTKGRIVKVKLADAPATQPAGGAGPATAPAAAAPPAVSPDMAK